MLDSNRKGHMGSDENESTQTHVFLNALTCQTLASHTHSSIGLIGLCNYCICMYDTYISSRIYMYDPSPTQGEFFATVGGQILEFC